MEEAKKLRHPFDSSGFLSDDLIRAAFDSFTKGPEQVADEAEAKMDDYESLIEFLQKDEDLLKSKLPSARAAIIKEKRVLLMETLFTEAGINDPKSLSYALINGIDLVGEAPITGEFPEKRKEPTMTV